jgi:hypothetical protein
MQSGKSWQTGSPQARTNRRERRRRFLRRIGCTAAILAAACLFANGARGQISALARIDSTGGDFFGTAVAVHGDRILVGATGVDSCGPNAGAAYVYRREVEVWTLEAVLQPDDCEPEAFFGRSVDLSGRFAAVAASREFFSEEAPNAVYMFERDTTSGEWTQTDRLTGGPAAQEGSFATTVSLDDDRLLVTSSGDLSGSSVDGSAHVFHYDPAAHRWIHRHHLEGSGSIDRGIFGTSGAIAGDVVAITASTYFRNRPGSVFIFEVNPNGVWAETRFADVDDFFISVDADAGRVLVGESKARRNESGSATLFEKDSAGTWRVSQVLRPRKPYDAGAFGSAIALDGDYALVVGFDEQLGLDVNIDRVVFVFKREPATGTWHQTQVLDVGEIAFGSDVDVQGRYAVVGSASEQEPGAAYVVRLPE